MTRKTRPCLFYDTTTSVCSTCLHPVWRLLVDAIKPVPYAYAFGLSGIQWVCIVALVCYLPFVFRQSMEVVRS